jgi:hypothetical protein
VVVDFGARVISGNPARVAGLGDDPRAGEVFEGAVDGGAGDAGEPVLDGFEDLIGRRVIVELEERFEDDPALNRATLAALAAKLPEEFDAFCPCRLVQVAIPRFPPSLTMRLDENM